MFVLQQVHQTFQRHVSFMVEGFHRELKVHHAGGIRRRQVLAENARNDVAGEPPVRVRVSATEGFPQQAVHFRVRQHFHQLLMVELFHGLLSVPADVSGTGKRDRVQGILVHLHFTLQRLNQSADVVDTVQKFVRRQFRPWIPLLTVIKTRQFRIRNAHLLREGRQSHVAVQVTAAELEGIVHGTLQDLPAVCREHFLRLEIVQALQELELEGQIVNVDHHHPWPYGLPHVPQELEPVFPGSPGDGDGLIQLKLPDVHDGLIHVVQRRRFDIEGAHRVHVALLLSSMRIPAGSSGRLQAFKKHIIDVFHIDQIHFSDSFSKSALAVLFEA